MASEPPSPEPCQPDGMDQSCFVERMLAHVASGLRSDSREGSNPANRIRARVEHIAQGMKQDPDGPIECEGRAVLESRFALGHDDAQYLAQAVSLLWTGDTADRLGIAHPSLAGVELRHASARGIVAAMARELRRRREQDVDELRDKSPRWLRSEKSRSCVPGTMK